MNQARTPTPETDEASIWIEVEDDEAKIGKRYGLQGNVEIVKADHARSLEMQRDALRVALENKMGRKSCGHDFDCICADEMARAALQPKEDK